MVFITDETIDKWIKEDVPYIDLTTLALDIAGQKGRMMFKCRDEAVICGTEEVLRIFSKLDIQPVYHLVSGTRVERQTVVLEGEGPAENLHIAWKVSQNILEYASGIATRTSRIVAQAQGVNPNVQVVTTRKVFPGSKELVVKAVIAGGGKPHRLGLSESILVFEQHLNFMGGVESLIGKLGKLKSENNEKKIIIEVTNAEDAIKVCRAGADGVQFDKMPPAELSFAVGELRGINPNITTLAAGGINESNADVYARTGVDALVTTAVYFGKPVDFGVQLIKS